MGWWGCVVVAVRMGCGAVSRRPGGGFGWWGAHAGGVARGWSVILVRRRAPASARRGGQRWRGCDGRLRGRPLTF